MYLRWLDRALHSLPNLSSLALISWRTFASRTKHFSRGVSIPSRSHPCSVYECNRTLKEAYRHQCANLNDLTLPFLSLSTLSPIQSLMFFSRLEKWPRGLVASSKGFHVQNERDLRFEIVDEFDQSNILHQETNVPTVIFTIGRNWLFF